jgi:hypothetical protein
MEPLRGKRIVKGRKGFLEDNPQEVTEGPGKVSVKEARY